MYEQGEFVSYILQNLHLNLIIWKFETSRTQTCDEL